MKLFYHVENGGDGSAYPNFHQTEAEAQAADEAQDEPFGEPSDGSIEFKITDGKLYYLADWPDTWLEVLE